MFNNRENLGGTQRAKAIKILVSHRERVWWEAKDFNRETSPFFIGYEAGPRLSELAKEYPAMIDTRYCPEPERKRFKQRRFRFENIAEILRILPKDLAEIVQENYANKTNSN